MLKTSRYACFLFRMTIPLSVPENKKLLLCLFLLCSIRLVIAQEKKPFLIRTIDWGYKLVQGDSAHPYQKYLFPVPILAYKPETKWIYGVSLAYVFRSSHKTGKTRPSLIRLNIANTQLHQFSLRPYVEYFSADNSTHLRATYLYSNLSEYFWGIGQQTSESNKELYHTRVQKANIRLAKIISGQWYAGLTYTYENLYDLRFKPGGMFDQGSFSGAGGYKTSGLGFTVYLDNRDNIYFPFKGEFIEFNASHFNPIFGGQSKFNAFSLDARKFIQLWKENILALNFVVFNSSHGTPYRMMGTLGSENYMRGYYQGRYRDLHAFALQAEVRKTIWGPVGCVIFAGGGNVDKDIPGLINHIKPNLGIGLRVKAIPRERMNVRLDYGFGSNGIQAAYLTLHEAF